MVFKKMKVMGRLKGNLESTIHRNCDLIGSRMRGTEEGLNDQRLCLLVG